MNTKFRGWNGKEMVYDVVINCAQGQDTVWLDGNLNGTEPHAWVEEGLIQCIGLVDSDNTDIYEGDILVSTTDAVLLKWVVCHNGYAFTVKNISCMDVESTQGFLVNDPLMFIDRKVVGNVYENTAMLKEEV